MAGNKMTGLGEAVDEDEDAVRTIGIREVGNKIKTD